MVVGGTLVATEDDSKISSWAPLAHPSFSLYPGETPLPVSMLFPSASVLLLASTSSHEKSTYDARQSFALLL